MPTPSGQDGPLLPSLPEFGISVLEVIASGTRRLSAVQTSFPDRRRPAVDRAIDAMASQGLLERYAAPNGVAFVNVTSAGRAMADLIRDVRQTPSVHALGQF